MAVASEVTHHDRNRQIPGRVRDLGLKRAVAVAQQHRYRAVCCVGDGQVEPAVAAEVARHDRPGITPDGVGDLGLERAVAVAQQHRHRIGAVAAVGDGQVERGRRR